jgi:hypothetical protein
MLYQGVGWIRPTRLAPEESPFFAVPGGSLAGLSDLMTEVPLNGRLAGLGCEGNRQCAPCAAAKLDQNRRENMDGLRGAQMAMQDQPRGWGLGAFGVDEEAPRNTALAYIAAVEAALTTPAQFNLAQAYALNADVADKDTQDFLSVNVMEFGKQAMSDLANYGDDPEVFSDRPPSMRIDMTLSWAKQIANGTISDFQITHAGMSETQWDEYTRASATRRKQIDAEIAASQPTLLQRIAMSSAGTAIVTVGAAASAAGATAANIAAGAGRALSDVAKIATSSVPLMIAAAVALFFLLPMLKGLKR